MGFSGSKSTGDFIYEYDKAGNIVKLTKPDKRVETREYDERSRLNKIVVNDKLVASYAYNKSGDLTSAYENFYQTKTNLSYTYDAAHRLTKEVRAYENGTNQSTEYSYDSWSDITGGDIKAEIWQTGYSKLNNPEWYDWDLVLTYKFIRELYGGYSQTFQCYRMPTLRENAKWNIFKERKQYENHFK